MIKKVALLLLLCLPAGAQATTLVYKDFNDLLTESTGVVEGVVSQLSSVKVGLGDYYTYVTLSKLRIHKGQFGPSTFTVRQRGGFVNGHGSYIVGSPSFARGDHVILFVARNGRDMIPFVGWEQ